MAKPRRALAYYRLSKPAPEASLDAQRRGVHLLAGVLDLADVGLEPIGPELPSSVAITREDWDTVQEKLAANRLDDVQPDHVATGGPVPRSEGTR